MEEGGVEQDELDVQRSELEVVTVTAISVVEEGAFKLRFGTRHRRVLVASSIFGSSIILTSYAH